AVSGQRGAVSAHVSRVKEAGLTAVALDPDQTTSSYLVGFAVLALLAFAAWRAGGAGDTGPAAIALAGAAALYALRFADGLGFVPGLVAATPLAVVGLTRGWGARAARITLAIALVALPVAWRLQIPGGAAP